MVEQGEGTSLQTKSGNTQNSSASSSFQKKMIYNNCHFMKQFTLFNDFVLCFMVISDYLKRIKINFTSVNHVRQRQLCHAHQNFTCFLVLSKNTGNVQEKQSSQQWKLLNESLPNSSLDENSLSSVEMQKNNEAALVQAV